MSMNEEEKSQVLDFISYIIPLIPKILFKYTRIFLSLKKQANNAGKTFKNELLKQGIDKKTADRLTDLYMESSKINNFFPKK